MKFQDKKEKEFHNKMNRISEAVNESNESFSQIETTFQKKKVELNSNLIRIYEYSKSLNLKMEKSDDNIYIQSPHDNRILLSVTCPLDFASMGKIMFPELEEDERYEEGCAQIAIKKKYKTVVGEILKYDEKNISDMNELKIEINKFLQCREFKPVIPPPHRRKRDGTNSKGSDLSVTTEHVEEQNQPQHQQQTQHHTQEAQQTHDNKNTKFDASEEFVIIQKF